jgi:hypothetical protein
MVLTLRVGVLASLAGLAQVIQAAKRQRLHTYEWARKDDSCIWQALPLCVTAASCNCMRKSASCRWVNCL